MKKKSAAAPVLADVSAQWLLLLYGLPAKQTSERVSLWRKLKKCGALLLKNGAYVLPDEPAHYERFQWLSKQIRDNGGEATLIRLTEIEGMPGEKIIQAFHQEREKQYEALARDLAQLIGRNKKKCSDSFADDLEKRQSQFREIQEIDYFQAPAAQNVRMLLQQAEMLPKRGKPQARSVKRAKDYQGRAWLTRPRPHIDRVGSAWLIRKFIDTQARFVFAESPDAHPDALPYDMFNVEFSHHGDDCTFETLVKRFGIEDRAVSLIAEMIHDADLEDGKFKRVECIGLDRVFKGWGKQGFNDDVILVKGFECFDALYATLQRK